METLLGRVKRIGSYHDSLLHFTMATLPHDEMLDLIREKKMRGLNGIGALVKSKVVTAEEKFRMIQAILSTAKPKQRDAWHKRLIEDIWYLYLYTLNSSEFIELISKFWEPGKDNVIHTYIVDWLERRELGMPWKKYRYTNRIREWDRYCELLRFVIHCFPNYYTASYNVVLVFAFFGDGTHAKRVKKIFDERIDKRKTEMVRFDNHPFDGYSDIDMLKMYKLAVEYDLLDPEYESESYDFMRSIGIDSDDDDSCFEDDDDSCYDDVRWEARRELAMWRRADH